MRAGAPLHSLDLSLDVYSLDNADDVLTPALIIYPELVDANISATLRMLGNDPNRWRPHIKTAKLSAILHQLIGHSVVNFKCSTTLELLTACQAGAADVLLAFPVTGANARRAVEIANQFPQTRVSVLVETFEQALHWSGSSIGVFIDVNPGMDRTGIGQERVEEIVALARRIGNQFRGLHYYDGHVSAFELAQRETHVHEGYDHLLQIIDALESSGLRPGELITSGTPATPFAITYPGFRNRSLLHRVSPGTVVFNDMTSLEQLPPECGYVPAAAVLSTVISHPTPNRVTCDAGHKSVSADAGIPTCSVIGRSDLAPLKPSEEHLPIEGSPAGTLPKIGEKLYLIPRHVCPTVNNFDEALFVVQGRIRTIERVTARGHESPLGLETEKLVLSLSS
ncbi:MAG: D-TA family PLP-dependent enzyme [Acidobacteriaceae bacterium]|nr:D-TA family PLP-dependent enzyme [Acidobacteriaceae bacterium]MBV9779849.1 D-TA family PLP-dependent enzyme [Acidobacteriaceae bacterium]